MFDGWKTYSLCIIILGLTFYGTYIQMLDASVFETVVWTVLGSFTAKEVGKKFAAGYINKHNKIDAE